MAEATQLPNTVDDQEGRLAMYRSSKNEVRYRLTTHQASDDDQSIEDLIFECEMNIQLGAKKTRNGGGVRKFILTSVDKTRSLVVSALSAYNGLISTFFYSEVINMVESDGHEDNDNENEDNNEASMKTSNAKTKKVSGAKAKGSVTKSKRSSIPKNFVPAFAPIPPTQPETVKKEMNNDGFKNHEMLPDHTTLPCKEPVRLIRRLCVLQIHTNVLVITRITATMKVWRKTSCQTKKLC
jgi:hypothetical protein